MTRKQLQVHRFRWRIQTVTWQMRFVFLMPTRSVHFQACLTCLTCLTLCFGHFVGLLSGQRGSDRNARHHGIDSNTDNFVMVTVSFVASQLHSLHSLHPLTSFAFALHSQVSMLAARQEKGVLPLGGSQSLKSDGFECFDLEVTLLQIQMEVFR